MIRIWAKLRQKLEDVFPKLVIVRDHKWSTSCLPNNINLLPYQLRFQAHCYLEWAKCESKVGASYLFSCNVSTKREDEFNPPFYFGTQIQLQYEGKCNYIFIEGHCYLYLLFIQMCCKQIKYIKSNRYSHCKFDHIKCFL